MVVGTARKAKFVSQLRTEREPRKESTMTWLVVSTATKPVMSEARELGEGELVRSLWLGKEKKRGEGVS